MADEKIQTNNESIARQCNRIIYIEPNDVYDRDCGNKQIGETLTPKYEDFCISFNLIIEQFQRFKTEGTASSNNNEDDDSDDYNQDANQLSDNINLDANSEENRLNDIIEL